MRKYKLQRKLEEEFALPQRKSLVIDMVDADERYPELVFYEALDKYAAEIKGLVWKLEQ